MAFLPAPDRLDPPAAEVHVWRGDLDEPLRRVLSRYLDLPTAEIRLTDGGHGKPRLADPEGGLRFNLSHSGPLTLVAVSRDCEVGVDIEQLKPGRNLVALAARALEPEEAEAVRSASGDDRVRLFYELWTRHEAGLKCLGIGLGGTPPQPAPPLAVAGVPIDPGFAAAVAVQGEAVPMRYWTLDRPRPNTG
ncbi:MAG TPA: 4'-phosphopantetheinyl transferase superfamily protein [Solirubrobacterales bacterium]|nr:4'-phosphopantetheinyl transferase superfamily protein [Solirubrobacterales bacterium]